MTSRLGRAAGSVFAAIALSLALTLAFVSVAEARWMRVTTPHFNVYGQQSEAELRGAAQDLERYHAALAALIGSTGRPARRLDVYLLQTREDLQRVVSGANFNVAGFYGVNAMGSRAMLSWNVGDRTQARHILFHEYAHHFMSQNLSQSYPAWFVEGFAEYLATAEFPDGRVRLGQSNENRLMTLLYEPWISLEELVTMRPSGVATRENTAMLYAQGWLLTQYLLQDPARSRQLVSYFNLLSEGKAPRDAFPQAFGASFSVMEQRLKTYLRSPRMSLIPIEATPASQISVNTLDASADEIMFLRLQLEAYPPTTAERRTALLEQIRLVAGRHPGAFVAQTTLAWAEYLYGDAAQALRILNGLPEARNDALSLYIAGMSVLKQSAPPEERRALATQAEAAFAQALRVDPTFFPALVQYAQMLDPTSERSLDALVQAHSLAPEIGELRINAALRLMRAGDFDYARRMLAPLANSPHPSTASLSAAILLEAAENSRPPPADLAERTRARLQAMRAGG